jgi:hypothetical protein
LVKVFNGGQAQRLNLALMFFRTAGVSPAHVGRIHMRLMSALEARGPEEHDATGTGFAPSGV